MLQYFGTDSARGSGAVKQKVSFDQTRGQGVLSMRISLMCAICLLTALVVVAGTLNATAIPLTVFRYEAQAQRHCPTDTVVWLDFRKEIYYSKHQKHYAQGNTGNFVCRKQARSGGYRRSLFGLR